MKIILKFLILLLLSGFSMTELFAQQYILSAGNQASGDGGTATWSVGLMTFSECSGISGTLSEGIQQPFEIFILVGSRDCDPGPECTVFPNPSTGNVTLKFNDLDLTNLSMGIYDAKGKQIQKGLVDSEKVDITMDDLVPATYYLVILKKEQPVKTFKIIKK